MKTLTLSDLVKGMAGWYPEGLPVHVHPVIDSRKASQGAVFFAFKGENVDGHTYVDDAFSRGAVAAVVDRDIDYAYPVLNLTGQHEHKKAPTLPVIIKVQDVMSALQKAATWWREELNPRVIGITGSVGKTTTKEVVSSVLERRYKVLRSLGSQNNEIGLPMTLLSLDTSFERVVLELGMYVRGDIRALTNIARPDIGIITNVEPVHAERAGNLDEIALGKRELIEDLPSAPEGVAILNYDDPRVRSMASFTSARVVTYGLTSDADVWADSIEGQGLEGIRLRLHYQNGVKEIETPLLGRHSAHTILRAAACGFVDDMGWDEVIDGLRNPRPQLRLVTVKGPNGVVILDDTYNSSPPSALAALNLLNDLPGRKVAVLGDMLELGDYEEEGHLKVGCRCADVVSELIAVGSLGEIIARGAAGCGLPPHKINTTPDSISAIDLLKKVMQPDDVVLVKGSRGMKMETIVAAVTEVQD